MNKNQKIDSSQYKAVLVEYRCEFCKVYDSIEEDFQSDISKIKSDSCSHFSYKFIYDVDKKSFKYLLSFNCNKCGTSHIINIFDDDVDFEKGIHYKCIKCGNGPLHIYLVLFKKDENNIIKNENENKKINKIYRTDEGNNPEVNSNYKSMIRHNVIGGDIENQNNNNKEIKRCYPFVLRYTEIPKESEDYQTTLIHCPLCPWYYFCPGCIINPNETLQELNSNYGIVVDWCTAFINEELIIPNFKLLSKDIDAQVISENLPFNDKDENYQSLKDCFDLFFVEENLEDPLYCHNCQGPEDFTKKYVINKMPYVLILSLKRFKFNQNSNFKLRQMIAYPLYNLELEGNKYDLYGVINHYGSINSGHYTCIIKKKDKKKNKDRWVMCDDNNVYYLDEKRVMNANAYILFYINKESPFKNDYFRFMKSLMNNVEKNEKQKDYVIKEDKNFFRGEPVVTKYGEGYVMEDNIDKFDFDENYDIYDDLKKKDLKRIEKIIKKDEEKEKENKDKKEDKEKSEEEDENKDKKKEEKKEEKEEKLQNKEDKKSENEKESLVDNKDNDKFKNEDNKANIENVKEEEKEKEKKGVNAQENILGNNNDIESNANNKEENEMCNEDNKNECKKEVDKEETNIENQNSKENQERINSEEEKKNNNQIIEKNKNNVEENKGNSIQDNNFEGPGKEKNNNSSKNETINKYKDINKEEAGKEENPNKIIAKEDNPNKIIENEDNPNKIIQNEDESKNIEKINNPNKIIDKEENLNKDFVRIKFDYGEGWINKKYIKKYNILKTEKEREKEEKQREKEMEEKRKEKEKSKKK